MQATIPGAAQPVLSPNNASNLASQPSRARAASWLRTVGGVWGLVTILVLGFSLLGQLGAERDWLGRSIVLLLLGGQSCLAALQVSRWRAPARS